MPFIEILPTDQAKALVAPKIRQDISEYLTALRGLTIGEGGTARPIKNEDISTVKRRFSIAARELGIKLKYKKLPDGRLAFRVLLTNAY